MTTTAEIAKSAIRDALLCPTVLVDMAPCTIHESTFLELVAESRAARK